MSDESPDFDEGIDDDFEDEIAGEGNRLVEPGRPTMTTTTPTRSAPRATASSATRAKAVVEHCTRALADEPDMVDIELQEKGSNEVFLLVHASPSDMGRLIGRRGRVIQAIRQVTRAAGALEGVKAGVDVAE